MAAAPLPERARSEEPQGSEGAVLGVGGSVDPLGLGYPVPRRLGEEGSLSGYLCRQGWRPGVRLAGELSAQTDSRAAPRPSPRRAGVWKSSSQEGRRVDLQFLSIPPVFPLRGLRPALCLWLRAWAEAYSMFLGAEFPRFRDWSNVTAVSVPWPCSRLPVPTAETPAGCGGCGRSLKTSLESAGCDTRSSTTALPSLP